MEFVRSSFTSLTHESQQQQQQQQQRLSPINHPYDRKQEGVYTRARCASIGAAT